VNQTQHVERAIEELAAGQFGVFSRTQAFECGASRGTIDYRVRCGAWQVVLPGVFRVAVAPASWEQLAMATALWCAPDGLVSHQAAGALWRFEGVLADRVHITVPPVRSLRSELVVVHHTSTLLPADIGRRGPIAVTSPLRTAVDLASVLAPADLEIAIESALRRRMFSIGQLRWRADALGGKGRRGSGALRRLLESRVLGASASGWEVRTARLLAAAGLGEPARQYEVRVRGRLIARLDLAYPEYRIAIEYDSDEWHHGVARRHRDIERRNRLRANGWTVVEVSAAQLRAPDSLIATVQAVIEGQGGGARRNSRR
jgi:hypothetical protein